MNLPTKKANPIEAPINTANTGAANAVIEPEGIIKTTSTVSVTINPDLSVSFKTSLLGKDVTMTISKLNFSMVIARYLESCSKLFVEDTSPPPPHLGNSSG
jgi:hypothetical protein